jgi:hypothetical protein
MCSLANAVWFYVFDNCLVATCLWGQCGSDCGCGQPICGNVVSVFLSVCCLSGNALH